MGCCETQQVRFNQKGNSKDKKLDPATVRRQINIQIAYSLAGGNCNRKFLHVSYKQFESNFELLEIIGEGSHGVVRKAKHKKT